MSENITMKRLTNLVAAYKGRLEGEGIEGELRLYRGSKTYGRAYRLYFEDGASAIGTSTGYLGMTKREAYETLTTIIKTLDDIHYIQTRRIV